jgi:ParB-like chromosome segregation protein Spo0J
MTDTQPQHDLVDGKRFVEIQVDQLAFAPWNYKLDDEAKLAKLVNNIKVNGQVENLIVRVLPTGFYEVVNGNHRLEAFRRLGVEKVVCYNLGTVSDVAARRLAIETNETRFLADDLKLAMMISEIQTEVDADDLLETMPYTDAQLKALTAQLDVDWKQIAEDLKTQKDSEGDDKDEDDAEPHLCKCPECGAVFDSKR